MQHPSPELSTHVYREIAQWLDWCLRTGLVEEAAHHAQAHRGQPARNAYDVTMSWIIETCGLAGIAGGEQDDFVGFLGGFDLPKREGCALLAYQMIHAVPYLWVEEIRQAALRSTQELPHHVVDISLMPHQAMWWCLEKDLLTHDFIPGLGDTQSYLLFTDQEYIMIFAFGNGGFEQGELPFFTVYPMVVAAWGTDSEKAGANWPDFARMLAFVQSRYIPKESHRLPRSIRRRAERGGGQGRIPDEVRMVTLRRPTPAEPRPYRYLDEEKEPVNWNWQWLVSGHFRNQWYPSEQKHHLIYVPPFMKGPPDKPVKPAGYRVGR